MTSVVYLWSQYYPTSVNYIEFVTQKKGRSLCIDHPLIREKILNGNIKINEIPCILVSSNGQISQYEGIKAIQWLESIKQQDQIQQPQQPQQQPQQSAQAPSVPQLNFQMAGERRPQVDELESPQFPSQQPPQFPSQPDQLQFNIIRQKENIPNDVTPISQIVPENETEPVQSNSSHYNQQAMNYYNQYNQGPQVPDIPQKKLSPKELEMQRMFEIAKQNMPSEIEDGNSILGSRS